MYAPLPTCLTALIPPVLPSPEQVECNLTEACEYARCLLPAAAVNFSPNCMRCNRCLPSCLPAFHHHTLAPSDHNAVDLREVQLPSHSQACHPHTLNTCFRTCFPPLPPNTRPLRRRHPGGAARAAGRTRAAPARAGGRPPRRTAPPACRDLQARLQGGGRGCGKASWNALWGASTLGSGLGV